MPKIKTLVDVELKPKQNWFIKLGPNCGVMEIVLDEVTDYTVKYHEVSNEFRKSRTAIADIIFVEQRTSLESTLDTYQDRVHDWLVKCFGNKIADCKIERNHRFLEESLELVQACGCTQSEVYQLVDYVFNRPKGEVYQEIGGVMVTLAALCSAQSQDLIDNAEMELSSIWNRIEKIRKKQEAKPKCSPLPGE